MPLSQSSSVRLGIQNLSQNLICDRPVFALISFTEVWAISHIFATSSERLDKSSSSSKIEPEVQSEMNTSLYPSGDLRASLQMILNCLLFIFIPPLNYIKSLRSTFKASARSKAFFKEDLPKPSNISNIKADNKSDIVTLVDVDFSEYRRKNDMRAVKKNCTIPSWFNFEAEKAGVNFSAILQSALKNELGLSDK